MTRAYLKLYFLLILPILVMALLPQNPLNLLTSWWASKQAHYEYGAIYPLIKEELENKPQEQWQNIVKNISKYFAYRLELKSRHESKLKQAALSTLNQEGHLLIKYKGNRTLLYPLENANFILYFSFEGKTDDIDDFEKSTRGFRYFLNKRIQEKDDIAKEFNRIKSFFNQELSLKRLKDFKAGSELHNSLLAKHVYNERIGDNYYSYILSSDNQFVVTVKGENKAKLFTQYYRYLANLIPAILLAIGALIWLYLFRKELKIVKTAAMQLGQGHFKTRATLSKSSTLYPIADSFNDMASRIQHLIEDHRDLTNAVSHELKTPLSRLHFALEMQKESKTEADRELYTQKIEDNIASLEILVDELLSYTRLQRQQEINLQAHPFKTWLEKEVSSFAEYHPEIKIICNADSNADSQKEVIFDKHLMARALNNLLDNATQHSQKKYKPIIRVTAKQISNCITISVEDNGTGIKNEDCNKIFQPFTRLDKSRKRQNDKLGGYGMGLAIVKSIITQHKGEISCEKAELGGLKITLSWNCAIS